MNASSASPAIWLRMPLLATLFVLLGVTIFVAVVAIALGLDDDTTAKLIVSLCLMVLTAGILAAGEAAFRRGRMRAAMLGAAVLAIAGLGLALFVILFEARLPMQVEERLAQFSVSCFIPAAVLAHSGLFSLLPVRTRFLAFSRGAVVAAAWLTGGLMVAFIWLAPILEEAVLRGSLALYLGIVFLIMLMGLAVLLGTIAVPIAAFSRANRDVKVESVRSDVRVHLGCPKCGHRQELTAGNVRCASCGVGLFIEVEEPRCACGYLLYQLQGQTCPECGRAIDRPSKALDSAPETIKMEPVPPAECSDLSGCDKSAQD